MLKAAWRNRRPQINYLQISVTMYETTLYCLFTESLSSRLVSSSFITNPMSCMRIRTRLNHATLLKNHQQPFTGCLSLSIMVYHCSKRNYQLKYK